MSTRDVSDVVRMALIGLRHLSDDGFAATADAEPDDVLHLLARIVAVDAEIISWLARQSNKRAARCV